MLGKLLILKTLANTKLLQSRLKKLGKKRILA